MAMSMASLLVALVLLSSATTLLAKDYCVYTVFVKTGWLPRSGTNANIGAVFYDASGDTLSIGNFTDWGSMLDSNYNYFEKNNVDVFNAMGDCLGSPICGMNLTSDGSGEHHGWYSESVEINTAKSGTDCNKHQFSVQQWLASDVYPYSLTTTRDNCNADEKNSQRSHLQLNRKISH